MDYQDTIEYKVRAADAGNNFISGLKLSLTIGDKTYQAVTENQGYATFKIHLQAGCYNVTTRYWGVVNKNIINITPIYVDNAFKDMYINSVTTTPAINKDITYGWKGNFKGLLQIYKGSSLIKTINLDTSGIVEDYLQYDKYSYTFSTSFLDLGDYDFKIIDKNGGIVAQSKVTVRKIPTEVYSFDTEVIKNYKESIVICLKEKLSGKDINGRVKVTINGKTYVTNIKDDQCILSFKSPSKLKKYTCTVVYDGDGNYAPSSSKFTLSVVKDDSDVLVTDLIKTKPNSKITVKAKIYYKYGTKKVKSGIVKFKINGKKYKAKIKNGIAKVKIKAPSEGKTYNCKATYLGNKNIKSSIAKFKITVKAPKKFKKKKVTKFTVVVPTELNKVHVKHYGIYSVKTHKYIKYGYHKRTAVLTTTVYKNGKKLSNYDIKYYWHYSFGGGSSAFNKDVGYLNYDNPDTFYNVMHIDWEKVTVWLK